MEYFLSTAVVFILLNNSVQAFVWFYNILRNLLIANKDMPSRFVVTIFQMKLYAPCLFNLHLNLLGGVIG